MVTISINDELQQFPEPLPLQELLRTYHSANPDTAFAVAVNGEFVPRTRYNAVTLNHGDTLDIVSPVGGG
jgi:sulfur carrier protein